MDAFNKRLNAKLGIPLDQTQLSSNAIHPRRPATNTEGSLIGREDSTVVGYTILTEQKQIKQTDG